MFKTHSLAKFLVPLVAVLLAACGGGQRPALEAPASPSARPDLQRPTAPVRPAPMAPSGPLTVARIDSYMDGLETALRQRLRGDGITIARMGDDITVILRNDILFSHDGTMNADDVLEPLVTVLGSYVHTSIAVGGFTDTVGTPDQNLALSTKRAKLIADGLAHEGIAPQRITSQGYGATHLRVATGDNKKEPRNRRIEILLKAKPG